MLSAMVLHRAVPYLFFVGTPPALFAPPLFGPIESRVLWAHLSRCAPEPGCVRPWTYAKPHPLPPPHRN